MGASRPGKGPEIILVENRRGSGWPRWLNRGLWILGGALVALTILQDHFSFFGSGARGLRTLVLVWVASIAAFVFAIWGRMRRVRELPVHLVTLADLPDLLASMARASDDLVYAGLWFCTADQPREQDAVNLNVSREGSRIGFDWMMLMDRNVRDRDRFLEFASARGLAPRTEVSNGVSYLRIDQGDIAALARGVVTELYGCPADQEMRMVCEGFVWPPL
jgi:hypothetical protein